MRQLVMSAWMMAMLVSGSTQTQAGDFVWHRSNESCWASLIVGWESFSDGVSGTDSVSLASGGGDSSYTGSGFVEVDTNAEGQAAFQAVLSAESISDSGMPGAKTEGYLEAEYLLDRVIGSGGSAVCTVTIEVEWQLTANGEGIATVDCLLAPEGYPSDGYVHLFKDTAGKIVIEHWLTDETLIARVESDTDASASGGTVAYTGDFALRDGANLQMWSYFGYQTGKSNNSSPDPAMGGIVIDISVRAE